jgi:LL-diaminopimelate aminotransferase
VRVSSRTAALPEYLTTRLNRSIAERRALGRDVISLGVGDPDLPPPAEARAALAAAVQETDAAHYPTNRGIAPLREAVAAFYARRFGVEIDPEREVLPLLGAKEGLAHLALAQLDPGDVALVADPGYPVYVGGPTIAGARPVGLPLLPANAFQPDLAAVPAAVRTKANLLIVGYPNNPTGAVAGDALFAELAAFGVPVCHDNAYSEITFDSYVAPSYLATPGAREAGIEILSLSKAFSLPGWRIAFAVGNAGMIENLHRLKTNVDAGMFVALQRAAVALLELPDTVRSDIAGVYERRRDLACGLLAAAGVAVTPPRAGMYIWLAVPGGEPSLAFAERMLADADVVVSPGVAYGPAGEGYVRLALTQPPERLEEAIGRMIRAL